MLERAKTLQEIRDAAMAKFDDALKKFSEGLKRQPGDKPGDRAARIEIARGAVHLFKKDTTDNESTDNT